MSSFFTSSSSGNQVEGLPLALSWLRSGRAAKRKIWRVFLIFEEVFYMKKVVIHQKVASYHIKASIAAT